VEKFPAVKGEPFKVRAYVESQAEHLPDPAFIEAERRAASTRAAAKTDKVQNLESDLASVEKITADREAARSAWRQAKEAEIRAKYPETPAPAAYDQATAEAEFAQREAARAAKRQEEEAAARAKYPTTPAEAPKSQVLRKMPVNRREAERQAAAAASAEATEILSMHPQGSDGWYAATRSILDDDLGSTLHESNLDLVDQIHGLGNADTDTFVAQAWDSMSEGGRQRLRDIGWRDPATAEQAALPAGPVAPRGARAAKASTNPPLDRALGIIDRKYKRMTTMDRKAMKAAAEKAAAGGAPAAAAENPKMTAELAALEQEYNVAKMHDVASADTLKTNMKNTAKGIEEDAAAEAAQPALKSIREAFNLDIPTVPYKPKTEQQALEELNTAAMTYQGGPREQAMRAKSQAMHTQAAENAERIASGDAAAEVAAHVMVEADVAAHEMIERHALLDELTAAVDDKGKLLAQREEVKATKAKLTPPKQAVKKANRSVDQTWSPEMAKVLDGLDEVAKANPGLLDMPLVVTEAELQAHRFALEREASNELRWSEVEGFMNRANNRSFPRQLVTTVGSNWSMVRKSAFKGDTAVLREGDYIMDKALHQMFTNLYNIQAESSKFGRLFRFATNMFKTYATLSPGFHVRNALSGIFMNTADGVSLAKQYQGAVLWKQWLEGGTDWLRTQPEQVRQAFRATFASGAGGFFREGGFAEASRMEKLLSPRIVRWSQRGGERVEGTLRLGMALDSIGKGDTLESAVQRLTRVHFDYSDVSAMDKTMKNYVPFWTFISRNLPLQVTQMWMRPQLYLKYNALVKNFAAPNDPFTPEYWLKNGAWNTGQHVPDVPGMGGAQGLPVYLQPDFGFSRVESDVNNLVDALTLKNPAKLASELNPLFTAPAEFVFGKNLYTDQQYGPTSYSKLSGPLNIPTNILARVFGQTNERGQVADKFTNLLTSINPVLDRSTRLLPQLSGGAFDEQRQLESYARFLGAPIRTLTPQQQRSQLQRKIHDMQQEHTRQIAMAKEAAS
jgi:hypothetical protein